MVIYMVTCENKEKEHNQAVLDQIVYLVMIVMYLGMKSLNKSTKILFQVFSISKTQRRNASYSKVSPKPRRSYKSTC